MTSTVTSIDSEEQPVQFELKLFEQKGLADCRYPLSLGAQYAIGRGHAAQIKIDHHSISRRHCIVDVFNEWVEIEDAGSKNGTVVGIGRLEKGRREKLTVGNSIELGPIMLVLRGPQKRKTSTAQHAYGATSISRHTLSRAFELDLAQLDKIGEEALRFLYDAFEATAVIDRELDAWSVVFGEQDWIYCAKSYQTMGERMNCCSKVAKGIAEQIQIRGSQAWLRAKKKKN